MTCRVFAYLNRLDAISHGVLNQSSVVIRLFEPVDSISQSAYCSTWYLSVYTVWQALYQLALYFLFVTHHLDILIHLFDQSQYDSLSLSVILRSTCSSEDLLYIKDANILVFSQIWIVHFSSLNDYCISWQVNTPCQSGSRYQYLNMPFMEEFLD